MTLGIAATPLVGVVAWLNIRCRMDPGHHETRMQRMILGTLQCNRAVLPQRQRLPTTPELPDVHTSILDSGPLATRDRHLKDGVFLYAIASPHRAHGYSGKAEEPYRNESNPRIYNYLL
ncbi:hypothetical protein BXZ70DRAFT_929810, partial [Cristinia sonorae]